ncbi:MAG: hypothetical protein IPM24_05960 [Bryobacterales bacterium]|nr:hypothetical protein [Bryobacterales bacterium]
MRRWLAALLPVVLIGATTLLTGVHAEAAPAAKRRVAKKTAKRKAPARRRPPPVSAQARAKASEEVEAVLTRSAEAYIENPAALVPFFEMLYRQKNGESSEPLRVLHYGDSHTAADEWTGAVRIALQSEFGDGGGGYSFAGKPFRSYRRLDLRGGATLGWRSVGLLRKDGDGLYGLGGISVATTLARQSIFLDAECSRLELFYLQQPGGGAVELFENGAAVARFSTDGPLGPGYFEHVTQPGAHHFELRTVERKPVRLFGWVSEKDTGVTYETLGINGAQASLMLRWDEELFANNVARRNPALIVLAYGTNEAGNPDWTQESYRDMFAELLARLRRAAPAASILVLGPPDRTRLIRGRWTPDARLDRIVAAQREAALASGCAYWDLREIMGGAGAMHNWFLAGLAQYDHVHFNKPGYQRLGSVLFRDLMYNYERYSTARNQLIGLVTTDGQPDADQPDHSEDR